MLEFQKLVSPLRSLFGEEGKPGSTAGPVLPMNSPNVMRVEGFPSGFHVYGITQGPAGPGQVLLGASDPVTSKGVVFLGDGQSEWKRVDLPDETALVSSFLRLRDGRYLAGGANSVGRGALLMGDPTGTSWKSVDLDLHSYGGIAALFEAPDSTLVVTAGQISERENAKPVLFRSADQGITWTREEFDSSATRFSATETCRDGTTYLGTAGEGTPILYRSRDGGRTLEKLPDLPAYKTYKTISLKLVKAGREPKIFALVSGHRPDLKERVVRMYASTLDFSGWEQLPEIGNSSFLYSFLVTRRNVFYAGSDKGRIFRSDDLGLSWEATTRFPTNVGAYALFEDGHGRIWVGKDFAVPSAYSLWQLT
ncbi:MAG: hypothetical protein V1798_08965 [Pseudomonadota bacterium]